MAPSTTQAMSKDQVSAALARFEFKKLLNQDDQRLMVSAQDQAGRRVSLLGTIDSKPAVLVVERAAFPEDNAALLNVTRQALANVSILGINDVYTWCMGFVSGKTDEPATSSPDVKLNLIWPCTDKHIAKYSAQALRSVVETPAIYRQYVRPYMERARAPARLQWIYDILDGRAEQEDVMHRRVAGDQEGDAPDEGFLLLPDLNWDRRTIPALHCLGLCERRDLWSIRDLTRAHVPWLRRMRARLVQAVVALYPQLEADQLKLYVHYQPTYYHFHIHVVHVALDPGATQAVGKAMCLDGIIDRLAGMKADADGMRDATLTYTLGEASDLWLEVFEPLKRGILKAADEEKMEKHTSMTC